MFNYYYLCVKNNNFREIKKIQVKHLDFLTIFFSQNFTPGNAFLALNVRRACGYACCVSCVELCNNEYVL